jgi:hypothetical protein
MGVRERIQPLLPRNVLGLEMAHIPDPSAIADLRRTLAETALETGRNGDDQRQLAIVGAAAVAAERREGGIRD